MYSLNDGDTLELDVGDGTYNARLISSPFHTKEEKEKKTVRLDPIELHETQIGACTVCLLDFIATVNQQIEDTAGID